MPRRQRGSTRRQGGNRGSGGRTNVDNEISRAGRPGSGTATVINAGDTRARPPSMALVQSPPKNLRSRIFWCKLGAYTAAGNAVSNTNPITAGFSFALNQISNYTSYTSIFDQYCIYAVNATITMRYNGTLNFNMGELVSAIDYDNASGVGFANLQNYGSAQTLSVRPDLSVQRFIKPCVAPALFSGSTFTDYGIARAWVDSASPDTQHYGLKFTFINNGVTGLTYDFWYELILGFRNNI